MRSKNDVNWLKTIPFAEPSLSTMNLISSFWRCMIRSELTKKLQESQECSIRYKVKKCQHVPVLKYKGNFNGLHNNIERKNK